MLKYGQAVSWKTSGCSYKELRKALEVAGLDVNRAKELLPRNAFARAAKKLQENRIIKKVKEEADYVYFQFTKEYATKERIDYSYEAIVRVDKKTGDVICFEDPALGIQAADLLDAEMETRNTGDITRLIQRIFEDQQGDLIALRDGGGFYFVPTAQVGLVDQVETLTKHIGGSVRRLSIAIEEDGSDSGTRQSIAESMVDHFNGLIEDFKDSCKTFNIDTNAEAVGRRTDKLIKLRTKLISYTSILQDQAEGISDAIKQADDEMLARLRGDIAPDSKIGTTNSQLATDESGSPISELDRLLAAYLNA